jgi:hypothetical protein
MLCASSGVAVNQAFAVAREVSIVTPPAADGEAVE